MPTLRAGVGEELLFSLGAGGEGVNGKSLYSDQNDPIGAVSFGFAHQMFGTNTLDFTVRMATLRQKQISLTFH